MKPPLARLDDERGQERVALLEVRRRRAHRELQRQERLSGATVPAKAAGNALTITAGTTRVLGTLTTGTFGTVVQSGGTLGGANHPGGGAVFHLTLPAAQPGQPQPS